MRQICRMDIWLLLTLLIIYAYPNLSYFLVLLLIIYAYPNPSYFFVLVLIIYACLNLSYFLVLVLIIYACPNPSYFLVLPLWDHKNLPQAGGYNGMANNDYKNILNPHLYAFSV